MVRTKIKPALIVLYDLISPILFLQHRFKDLQERFMRTLEGEDSTKEKDIVTDICKEVPAFSSLTTELNW